MSNDKAEEIESRTLRELLYEHEGVVCACCGSNVRKSDYEHRERWSEMELASSGGLIAFAVGLNYKLNDGFSYAFSLGILVFSFIWTLSIGRKLKKMRENLEVKEDA